MLLHFGSTSGSLTSAYLVTVSRGCEFLLADSLEEGDNGVHSNHWQPPELSHTSCNLIRKRGKKRGAPKLRAQTSTLATCRELEPNQLKPPPSPQGSRAQHS